MALVYTLKNDNTYEVSAGSCTAGTVIIPSIYNGKAVTSIGAFAFQYCSSLLSIEMPDTITTLGLACFQYCDNLASVQLSNSLTTITAAAFHSCFNLNYIKLPDTILSIGGAGFYGTSLSSGIILSNSLTSIGVGAFQNGKLKSITMPASLNYIGFNSFSQNINLTKINFLGNFPNFDGTNFNNTNLNLKLYRKKNFVTGWTDSVQGVPVVLWSDNVIKSGGTGKLTTKKRN